MPATSPLSAGPAEHHAAQAQPRRPRLRCADAERIPAGRAVFRAAGIEQLHEIAQTLAGGQGDGIQGVAAQQRYDEGPVPRRRAPIAGDAFDGRAARAQGIRQEFRSPSPRRISTARPATRLRARVRAPAGPRNRNAPAGTTTSPMPASASSLAVPGPTAPAVRFSGHGHRDSSRPSPNATAFGLTKMTSTNASSRAMASSVACQLSGGAISIKGKQAARRRAPRSARPGRRPGRSAG